jgi:hypothetical protein
VNLLCPCLLLLSLACTGQIRAGLPAPSPAPARPSFEEKLRAARYDLRVGSDGFEGTAAPILAKAIAEARFVGIGEDHLSREIPTFATAVCDQMADEGLFALAMEIGPQLAAFMTGTMEQPDRIERLAAWQKRYPSSVVFLNSRQENDLVSHAAKRVHGPGLQLWGLDQEFLGAAGSLLDAILATAPGPEATAALTALRKQEEHDADLARASGDPAKLFLLAADDQELASAGALLQRQGSPAANDLFSELVRSHEIYVKSGQGDPDANGQRARLLKEHLHQHFVAAEAAGQRGKVLLKFGDWHLYKGFNPLHQRDLGAYLAEVAEGQGERSLNIAVLGAKGVHIEYGGYERLYKAEPFVLDEDEAYRWLKPAIDNQVAGAWTLYDLRQLRFKKFAEGLDMDMQNFLYSYDLLVIIPELTPAQMIE